MHIQGYLSIHSGIGCEWTIDSSVRTRFQRLEFIHVVILEPMYKLSKYMKVNYKLSYRCGCKSCICKLGSTSLAVQQMVLRDEVYEVANHRNDSECVSLSNHTGAVQNKGSTLSTAAMILSVSALDNAFGRPCIPYLVLKIG